MLADTSVGSGAEGACLGLGPQRNSPWWLSLVGMQPVTASLQRERPLIPRPPKTLNEMQDHVQQPSTVSLSLQILLFNFKRVMGDPGYLLRFLRTQGTEMVVALVMKGLNMVCALKLDSAFSQELEE